MDFTTRKARIRTEITRIESEDIDSLYPHNVMMYNLPPTQDMPLQMFEEYAIERVNLLRILEQATSKNLRILSDDWKNEIKEEMKLAGMKSYLRLIGGHATTNDEDTQARRRDYISHFILRLAYCRSTDLRRWFVTREMEWFKLKFSCLSQSEINRFLEINKLNYHPITDDEKSDVIEGLYDSTAMHSIEKIDIDKIYKVHFTVVPDLIRARRCYIKAGYAYVIANDFISIVAGLHEACIENGLTAAAEALPDLDNDERLVGLLKTLHTSYTGKDYVVGTKGTIPIESIDQLSKKSFPLCMRQCHETLRSKHHLKHHGRLQYGLFLKGIGVTLEDSLRFWRAEFTKVMDLEKFEKSYAYNVRYNYGKEGQAKNWAPHSCLKIISQHVGPQETHGCPFRTMDANSLRAKLTSYGFNSSHTQEVVSFATKGHYQLACGRYFAVMHETPQDESITHPNQYFDKSQLLIEERTNDGTQKPTQRPSQKLNNGRDIGIKRNKNPLMDEYDDELWNVAQEVERKEQSKADVAAWNEVDDFDGSQMEEF